MIDHNWYLEHRILEVRPLGPLTEDDFQSLAVQVDPVISEYGRLSGLLINAQHFAGWESFVALLTHLRFVRDHQKHIRKIAVVSDHRLLGFMPQLVDHFVSAEVRPFSSAEFQRALDWLSEPG